MLPSILTVLRGSQRNELGRGLLVLLALAVPAAAAIPAAATQDPRYALGYLVVTYYPNVDPSGVQDSTAGIQQAIDDARPERLAVFFPNQANGSPGIYKISDTLRCYTFELASGAVIPASQNAVPLVGSSLGTSRPVIKLAASAPSFDNVNKVKPMIAFRYFGATDPCATAPVNPANAFDNPPCFKSRSGSIYGWDLRNLDFDCNGHAGAVGVSFPGAQWTFMGNIRIDATGAYAGIIGMPGVAGSGNIEVIGGQYGVKSGPYNSLAPGSTASGGGTSADGLTIAGLKLFGQTQACIVSSDTTGNPAIAGFHLKPAASATAIEVSSGGQTARGPLCLLDGIVELPPSSSAVALSNAAGKSVYYRNVYITNTGNLIQSGGQATIAGTGTWKRIREYAYTDQTNPAAGDPPYESGDTVMETFSVINGAKSRSPAQPIVNIESGASAPPADLISRHVWNSLPSFEDGLLTDATHGIGTFVSVVTKGATPVTTGDAISNTCNSAGGDDDAAAFQAAIDEAWNNGNGHGRVFVPRGGYQIGSTLTLRKNTTFFGVGRRVSAIGVHSSWQPTSGSPYMIQTVNDASATTFLGFLAVEIRTLGGGTNAIGAQNYDRFSHLLWRAGKASATVGWQPERQWQNPAIPCNPRIVFTFSGNGGGRHYAYSGLGTGRQTANLAFREIFISGTTQPLWFYGCNVEATKLSTVNAGANIEVANAANVRLLGFKREGESPTLIVNNSSNVALFGHEFRDESEASLGGTLQVLGSSSGVLIALVNARNAADTPSGTFVLREAISGQPVLSVPYPEAFSIYKRGELDDAAVYIGNPPPTVALTSPAASATFVLGETVPLAATASDADGIALVEFYRGGTTFIGQDMTAPYTFNWSPGSTGSYSLTAVAHDLGNPFASTTSAAVPISVVANSVPNITTTSLPGGTVGAAYNQTLAATGGNGTRIWSLASGSLPAGLSLSSGGTISGTPTVAGTPSFTVRVADSDGITGAADEDTQALSIAITGGSGTTITRQVNASNNDRETGGSVSSPDLELGSLFVGVRFTNVTVPQGATITSAKVTFRAESGVSSPASVTIYGENQNNPVHFGSTNPLPDARVRTSASVAWSNITSIENVATPNIASIVQQIVNRAGWSSGNAMVILFQNNGGKADAAAYDLAPAKAPVLEITYQ